MLGRAGLVSVTMGRLPRAWHRCMGGVHGVGHGFWGLFILPGWWMWVLSDMMQPSIRVALTTWSYMEPEQGFEPGSAGYKATTLPFELSSIDSKDLAIITTWGSVQHHNEKLYTNENKFLGRWLYCRSMHCFRSQ